MMRARLFHLVLGLIALLSWSSPARAQHPIPEAERWATITHPANPNYSSTLFPRPYGRVEYEYQISKTEVTAAEWLEFVRVCAPYVDTDDAPSSVFLSQRILRDEVAPGVYEYRLDHPSSANKAITVGWRFAARYCNWLHNNKGTEREAFEHGAYETSTFGGSQSAGYTDQHARSAGASYFIPTIDEWVKAVYWDPDRANPEIGDPGYWLYPHTSDTPPIGGPPGVGQTSAGAWTSIALDVASYPDVQSPWGLLDASGGESELLETAVVDEEGRLLGRYAKGSRTTSPVLEFSDHVRTVLNGSPTSPRGFRIARAVPSPTSVQVGTLLLIHTLIRKRRR